MRFDFIVLLLLCCQVYDRNIFGSQIQVISWVEEEDALPEDAHNSFTWQGTSYPAMLLCDLLHTEGDRLLR